MLDIVIPSKTERFLYDTIKDVLKNATGEVTIYPILDGYDLPPESEYKHEPDGQVDGRTKEPLRDVKQCLVEDDRVKYIKFPATSYAKKRQGINLVAQMGQGDYIMSLDAHCMVAPGFDEQLIKDHQWNWVQVPRRHRLDAENWCLQEQVDSRPPIDYEYTMWPLQEGFKVPSLHGFKWDARTIERQEIPIDDTMHIQGSCWFMTKEWFKKCNFMDLVYQGWGQEGEEIVLQTNYMGGEVKTNKNTWYAHLHKGPMYGRMYHLRATETRASSEYAYNYWVNDHRRFFTRFIKKFWPVPSWPNDWEKILWK